MSRVALIVGAAPASTDQFKLVAALAESAEMVIGADGGGATCTSAGVVPNVVVGDFDSLPRSAREVLGAAGTQFEEFPADKDVSDLDLALSRARVAQCDSVSITGVFSERFDHTLAALGSACAAADLRPVIVELGFTASILHPEHRSLITIDGVGRTFSLLACLGPSSVTVTGAKWPLDAELLEPLSAHGLSNAVAAATANVTCHLGTCAVVVPGSLGR